jgi:hypothetical protein
MRLRSEITAREQGWQEGPAAWFAKPVTKPEAKIVREISMCNETKDGILEHRQRGGGWVGYTRLVEEKRSCLGKSESGTYRLSRTLGPPRVSCTSFSVSV